MLFAGWEVRIVKNCDRGHTFLLDGPTLIYLIYVVGPGKPQNVSVEATSSTSINVSWKEPFLLNGVISEYWIYFGQQKDDLNKTMVEGSGRSWELIALRPFTTYYIKVRAKTTELGNASALLIATTFEDSKFFT